MQKFKAYRTFQENDAVKSRFVEMTLDELDPGDVVVRTKYSTINYKDALSYNGAGKIMRKYPTNAGIDMAGTVESSADTRWKKGDKVIVHAYDVGVAHDGGYSEYVRVPGDWVVRRPESMTAFDAMTLGTAGFTAAQAIMLMEHNGLKPENGPVAVTGATGGVGSVAVEILAKTGYHVVAITGKPEEARYLRGARARRRCCSGRRSISRKIRPLDKSTWAGAIDNLGGDMLAWLLVDVEDRRDGERGRSRRRHVAQYDGRAVHPARRLPARRRQRQLPDGDCGRRSGTSSPSSGGPTVSTTRFARSTSTIFRRISTPISRGWSGAGPWCVSRPIRIRDARPRAGRAVPSSPVPPAGRRPGFGNGPATGLRHQQRLAEPAGPAGRGLDAAQSRRTRRPLGLPDAVAGRTAISRYSRGAVAAACRVSCTCRRAANRMRPDRSSRPPVRARLQPVTQGE